MYTITGDSFLVSKWQNLITAYAKRPFNFGEYSSIDDILDKLGVNVILESDIVSERVVPRELMDAEKFWDEENSGTNNEKINKAKEMVGNDINSWKTMPLRGCYIPDNNVIKLYPNEMKDEYDEKHMEELIVSTLAHETMHAYYNRHNRQNVNCHQYVAFFEEPLAEFGMLLYLKETNCVFYDWAKKDVAIKPTFYRYGAYLMDQDLSALGRDSSLRQFLEGYKIMRPVISEPEIINGHIYMPNGD